MREVLAILLCILCLPLAAVAEDLQLTIQIDGQTARGVLEDSAIARQLEQMSPINIEMKDFLGQEKLGYPPERLDLAGAARGLDPQPGDIAIYAPWGNLCVFTRDAAFSDELIFLGRLTSGLEVLAGQDSDFKSQWRISAGSASQ